MSRSPLLRAAALLAAAGGLSCAGMPGPRGGVSYVASPQFLEQAGAIAIQDARGPLSYQAPTPGDMRGWTFVRRVRGEACQADVRLPLALVGEHATGHEPPSLDVLMGDEAISVAMQDAMRGAPAGAQLYDLTLDLHKTALMGVLFRRQCLVLSAAMALPPAGGTAAIQPAPAASAAPAPGAAPLPLPLGAASAAPAAAGTPGPAPAPAEKPAAAPVPMLVPAVVPSEPAVAPGRARRARTAPHRGRGGAQGARGKHGHTSRAGKRPSSAHDGARAD